MVRLAPSWRRRPARRNGPYVESAPSSTSTPSSLWALPVGKARTFTRHAGLPEAVSSIVPVVVGEAEAALTASRMLEDEGFLVVPIRPPTVPDGTARLRFAFAAGHPDDEIVRLADIVRTRVVGNNR